MTSYKQSFIQIGLIVLLLGGFFCINAIAKASTSLQELVSGQVTNSETGESLPGVNVVVKGTTIGTSTNADGEYQVTVESLQDTLVFSFIGYQTLEVPINGRNEIDVELQSQAIIGEDLVVIGYGSIQSKDMTGSVSQVNVSDIQSQQVYNIEEALQSLSAGVRVTPSSGDPTAGIEVEIRGANSMRGDNKPLYVVDGFPLTGGVHHINPDDVESLNVLKDASASAIYGARGANGVVIIETKKGMMNQEGRIEIDSYYGIQQEIDRLELLNAREYAIVANEWMHNEGQEPIFDNPDQLDRVTDWQDLIFRTAPVENHTVTFSGGSANTSYSLSGNYFRQKGIVENSGVKRGSMRLNLSHDVNDWIDMSGNIKLSRRFLDRQDVDNGHFGGSIYTNALAAPPTQPVYDEETGLPIRASSYYPWSTVDLENPVIYFDQRKNNTTANTVIASASIDINITDELVFTSTGGLEYEYWNDEFFTPVIFPGDQGSISESFGYRNSILSENTLEYSSNIGTDHALNVLGGFTYQSNMNRGLSAGASGLSNNILENYDLSSAEVQGTPNNGITEWDLLSYIGRVNYSFQDRYLFTASIRADGSSRFGVDKQWGYFPSGAIGWRVTEEPFMDKVSFIDNLKLRASYGVTGNTSVNPYQSLSRIRAFRHVEESGVELPAFVPDGLPNPELKWEETTQLDVGIDLTILNNSLDFTFDYYKKSTTDLLATVPLPSSTGFSSILQNVGEIENEGLEVSVGADILQTTDLSWNINGQISRNINVVQTLAGGSDILVGGGHPFQMASHIVREGKSMGSFYGYIEQETLGDDGLPQYEDISNDGEVTASDRVILGKPQPDFIYGIQSSVGYKNFNLNIVLDGVYGNEIFWATAGVHLNSFERGHNQIADLFGNYWTEDNPDPNAKYPKIGTDTNHFVSDRFIYDGSYLRVKTIRLAYNIPTNVLNRIGVVRDAQVYATGANLFTFTSYPGINPDVSTRGGLRPGVDRTAYPQTKNIVFGIKLEL